MPRNLEYKARVGELKSLEEVFVDHGATLADILDQVDTYFCVRKGRLKLREARGKKREVNSRKQELIFFTREMEPQRQVCKAGMISLSCPTFH